MSMITFCMSVITGLIIKRYVIRGTAYVVATFDYLRIGWVVFLSTILPLLVRTPFTHSLYHLPAVLYGWTYTWTMLTVLGTMLGYWLGNATIAKPKPLKGGLSVEENGEVHVIPPVDNTKHPKEGEE